jgi:hypothetical protein
MTASLLSIGAAVLKKSAAAVQAAMAAVPVAAVAQWVRDKLGLTIPAQQALAFQRNKNVPKDSTELQPGFLQATLRVPSAAFSFTSYGTRSVPATWREPL